MIEWEWIKNICWGPIKYSMEKTNELISNSAVFFFNMYGSRLLDIPDKIIKSNEIDLSYNIFKFFPLPIKKIEQSLSDSSTLHINSGSIDDLIIQVPRSLTEQTTISISKISLCVTIQSDSSVYFSAFASNNSYFNIPLEENTDLLSVYRKISSSLTSYIQNLQFQIDLIEISLGDNLRIILRNITHTKKSTTIDQIEIISVEDSRSITKISQIIFSNKTLQISNISIESEIIDLIPVFYLSSSESTLELKIIIETINIDSLQIKNLSLSISPTIIFLEKLDRIKIQGIFSLKNLVFHYENNTIYPEKIHLHVNNIFKLKNYINQIQIFILKIRQKIISSTNPSSLIIKNLHLILVLEAQDIFEIKINEINTHPLVLHQTTIIIDETTFIIKSICNDPKITAFSTLITSPTFDGIICEIIVYEKTIEFVSANVNNPVQMVDFVRNLIKKFSNQETSETSETSNIELIATESNLNIVFHEKKLSIKIIKGSLLFSTNINITNLHTILSIDDTKIAHIIITFANKFHIKISSAKIFLNQCIISKINSLFDCFSSKQITHQTSLTEGQLQLLSDALNRSLNRSFIVNSIEELDIAINNATSSILRSNSQIEIIEQDIPKTKFLDDNLIFNYINSYVQEEKEENKFQFCVEIDSLHINLSDQTLNNPFLCLILKKIIFTHKEEDNAEEDIIRVVQYGSGQKSNKFITYDLKIEAGAIIDILNNNPEWKYFAKFSSEKMMNLKIKENNSMYKIHLGINPIVLNVREEVLMQLVKILEDFRSNKGDQTEINLEYFYMKEILLNINYYPKHNLSGLVLKDFCIKLSEIRISHISGVDKLFKIIDEKWKNDINLDNYLQFVPNIKIIKPIATPLIQFINQGKKYFGAISINILTEIKNNFFFMI